MTDTIDQTADDNFDEHHENGDAGRRRRMFLTGAGIAGAAAIVGKSGVAQAADGDPVAVGGSYDGATPTSFNNNGGSDTTPGTPGGEALVGTIEDATNGSHAIRGVTAGRGHAVAGIIGTAPDSVPTETVAATWGRHYGTAAAVEGQQLAEGVDLAGPANAVKGVVESPTNGSHAVLGITNGAGHAVAGDIPAGTGNTVGATWGRHAGLGAGAEGINVATDVELAGPANGVKGTVDDPSNGSHAVLGITNGAGHSIAGDTPAEADNTVAATWGRHNGAGAGIGGVSAAGYGGEFVGGRASVRLIPSDGVAAGAPTDGDSQTGELFVDGVGNLFYNVGPGANFTQLNNQAEGGQSVVLFDDPQRAYDSREGNAPNAGAANQQRFEDGETKMIDLTAFTDYPAGARAALVNITVAGTDAIGFLTAFNGDTAPEDLPLAASVTWAMANERNSNSLTVRTNAAGQINVYTKGSADVIVDVTGYLT